MAERFKCGEIDVRGIWEVAVVALVRGDDAVVAVVVVACGGVARVGGGGLVRVGVRERLCVGVRGVCGTVCRI